jgi:hypothetical protein
VIEEGNMPVETDAVAKLKKRLRGTVKIEDQELYVAEGDLLLDEQQLRSYAEGGQPAPEAIDEVKGHELIAVAPGGKIARWRPGLELAYAVLERTFSPEEYQIVRGNMKQATDDWERTCGVKFAHRAELDGVGRSRDLLFTVRKVNAGGRFIAAAFFPDEPASRRMLVIDPSYFTLPPSSFDMVGVLRHELGHVLGFRHEHIRSEAPAVCPQEDLEETIELTKYDPHSVMHYFCGGVGSRELRISEEDRIASQRVYGPPLGMVRYFE